MPTNTDNSPLAFKKGDFLIDYGQVFRIIRIDKIKTNQGSDNLLVFKPYFKTGLGAEVISSLPAKNLEKTTIRKPLNKKDINKVLSVLSRKKIEPEAIDVLTAKAVLNQNQPEESAETIQRLFTEKNNLDLKFTSSKKYVYRLLISRLAEEVALAYNISLEKAEAKIENKLKK